MAKAPGQATRNHTQKAWPQLWDESHLSQSRSTETRKPKGKMNTEQLGLPLPEPKPERPDDYFGLCPVCHGAPTCLNIGKDHWMVCHEHKVCWCVGSNLFSAWRHEDPKEWDDNAKLLRGYEEVDSYHYPVTCCQCGATAEAYKQGWHLYRREGHLCPRCAPEWQLVSDTDDPNDIPF
jgi:hypothetical protein